MITEQERLQMLMQKENLTAKDFANEVGISAGTMSNILGGRNKPSLEVMQKVLQRFRMVSPEWLILGVGTMYKLKPDASEQVLFDIRPESQAPQGNNISLPQPDMPNTAYFPQNSFRNATTLDNLVENGNVVESQQYFPGGKPLQTNSVKIGSSGGNIPVVSKEKKISRIIVFYNDGSFDELSQ